MNETKPVPTYLGAFLKGGCVGFAVGLAYAVLFFSLLLFVVANDNAILRVLVTAMLIFHMFLPGGCVGLYMRWNYDRYFTTQNQETLQKDDTQKIPTKIGAFFKGGCVSSAVFLMYFLYRDFCDYAPAGATSICSFLMSGFAGLFLRWNYRKYFITNSTPTTDVNA